jgi:hypothetical protein
MRRRNLNRLGAIGPVACSLLASLLVLRGVASGIKPGGDEDGSAHLFQLLIVAEVPLGILFLATAKWDRPLRAIAVLGAQAAALAAAFGALAWSGY